MELVIDLGTNQLEPLVLKGYLSLSKGGPQNATLTHDGAELRVSSPTDITADELSELLRVLGGSCKGDMPIRVTSPKIFEGAVAIPYESGGAPRWKCPRCDRAVMQGANDAGTVNGLCHPCWATDMKVAGHPVAPVAPIPSAPAAALPKTAPLHAGPSSSSASTLPQALEPLAAYRAAADEASVLEGERVAVLPSLRNLPRAEDSKGCCAIINGRFAYCDGHSWRVLDGHVPPHE